MQYCFKLTFEIFWPLCNIKNYTFDIFHATERKFSPQTPRLFFLKTQWSFFFLNWLLTIFDQATVFMLESWNFHHRYLARSFFKTQWSQFLKIKFWPFLTFDHFATSKMHLAMFHARGLKFSPQTPCLLFFKTQWSILFKLNYDLFWPLYNMKNAYFAIFETTL